MKKKLVVLLAAACLVGNVGCSTTQEWFNPWDNLGGGGIASGGDLTSGNISDYVPGLDIVPDLDIDLESGGNSGSGENENFEENESCVINLSQITEENAPAGTGFEAGTLTIKESGAYILTGEMIGNVVVKDTEEAICLALKGVNISTPETSTSAAIVFQKTSAQRILTVMENTENVISDSIGDTDADGDSAAIQAKKCSLIINGSGKLVLKGVGENASGLKVKKELAIMNTQIEIEAVNNGIKADEKIVIYNADLKINALGDGIKTDMEAGDQEEANEFAADPEAGYIYIKNSSFDITAGDDGISANNLLYIDNTDEDMVKILCGGGAPGTITETSSDNANGKALKAGGIKLVEGDEETDIPAQYEENYALVITGGIYEINSNDDALSSKGNLFISGGKFTIQSGDDGIHAEYLTRITGGDILVSNSYEALEGAAVEIMDGKLRLVSVDDGINAANGDLNNYDFHIYIGGGDIMVNAQGDGVDSNGWTKIEGGKLIIYGPTNGGNGSLDSDRGVLVNGGDLIAVGSMGMVENPGNNSKQCYISINLSERQNAETKIEIYDEAGTLLYEVTPTKTYQSVIISLSAFVQGNTYTVKVGNASYEATLTNIGTALGINSMGGGNQGFNPGGFGPGGFGPGGR